MLTRSQKHVTNLRIMQSKLIARHPFTQCGMIMCVSTTERELIAGI